MRPAVPRGQSNRALSHPPRLTEPPGAAIDLAHVAGIDGDIRRQRHRALHPRDGLVDPAAPVGDDACEMQHMRMRGRGGQDARGEMIRLLQPGFPLQHDDFGKNLGKNHLLAGLCRNCGLARRRHCVHAARRAGWS